MESQTSTPPKPNKEIIQVNKYTSSEKTIIAYTAEWCGPCNRIKPFVVSYLLENGYVLTASYEIKKTEFKENVNDYIPFFKMILKPKNIVIKDTDTDTDTESCEEKEKEIDSTKTIQTSKFEEFRTFEQQGIKVETFKFDEEF